MKNPNALLELLVAEWEAGRVKLFVSEIIVEGSTACVEFQTEGASVELLERLRSTKAIMQAVVG